MWECPAVRNELVVWLEYAAGRAVGTQESPLSDEHRCNDVTLS
jgi:hypothetical protein